MEGMSTSREGQKHLKGGAEAPALLAARLRLQPRHVRLEAIDLAALGVDGAAQLQHGAAVRRRGEGRLQVVQPRLGAAEGVDRQDVLAVGEAHARVRDGRFEQRRLHLAEGPAKAHLKVIVGRIGRQPIELQRKVGGRALSLVDAALLGLDHAARAVQETHEVGGDDELHHAVGRRQLRVADRADVEDVAIGSQRAAVDVGHEVGERKAGEHPEMPPQRVDHLHVCDDARAEEIERRCQRAEEVVQLVRGWVVREQVVLECPRHLHVWTITPCLAATEYGTGRTLQLLRTHLACGIRRRVVVASSRHCVENKDASRRASRANKDMDEAASTLQQIDSYYQFKKVVSPKGR